MTDLDAELLEIARQELDPVKADEFWGIVLDDVWVMRKKSTGYGGRLRTYTSKGRARSGFSAATYYVARDFYRKKKIRFVAPDSMYDAHQQWVAALEKSGRLEFRKLDA